MSRAPTEDPDVSAFISHSWHTRGGGRRRDRHLRLVGPRRPRRGSQTRRSCRRHRDAQGPDRPLRHRLQLEHRARARRASARVAVRHARPAARRHRRVGQSGDGAFPVAERAVEAGDARAELRVRPARSGAAAEEVRRPRRDARAHAQRGRHVEAGDRDGAPARLQRRAGLADRQRDRDRLRGRAVSLPRDSRQPAQPSDARLEAGEQRRARAPDRDVVPGRQHVVERRLRAHRRPRRPARGPRRLGDGLEHERHVLSQHAAAARRGRAEPRRRQHAEGRGRDGEGGAAGRVSRGVRARGRSPSITSTRSTAARRSRRTRPSRSRC